MNRIPNQFPPLDPPGTARIAIVQECPHPNAAEQGMLLTSGELDFLYKLVASQGIVLDQCFIGSVAQVGVREFSRLDWDGAEVQNGIMQLKEDLLKFNPSVVLCLGDAALHIFKAGNVAPRKTKQKSKDFSSAEEIPSNSYGVQGEPATGVISETTTALSALSKESPHETIVSKGNFKWPNKVGNWRGSLFESDFLPERKLKCLSTYHPSAVLRDWSLQPYVKFDAIRLVQESKTRELVVPERHIQICRSIGFAVFVIASMSGKEIPVSFDIEGHVGNITSIAFSDHPKAAYVIPFTHADGTSFWSEEDEAFLWESIKHLLEKPTVPKIAQNGLYDCFVIAWTLGICVRNFAHDTMVGMFECFAELEKGLAVQTSILTKQPYYKPDRVEEGELKFESDHDFWHYNGLDACVTYECWQKQQELMNEGQKSHYQFNMSLMPALLYMQVRGMKWDVEAAMAAREETIKKVWELQAMVDKEVCLKVPALEHDYMLHDLTCLHVLGVIPSESEIARIVTYHICKSNIRVEKPHTEHRWQPMRLDGKRWKKDGKLITNASDLPIARDTSFILDESPKSFTVGPNIRYDYKPKHTTKLTPFTPTTLEECEPFILESKRAEWKRVKEIWKELNGIATLSYGAGTAYDLRGVVIANTETDREGVENPAGHLQREISDSKTSFLSETQEKGELNEKENAQQTDKVTPLHGKEFIMATGGEPEGSCTLYGESCTSVAGSTARVSGRNAALLGELSTFLSLSINVGSTQADGDAQWFLYEVCGLDPQFKKVKGKKTDKVSTDSNALVQLYSKSGDVRVLWVKQLRELKKVCTDLALEVDEDGRLRSTFSLVKSTGRMSASISPTGKGTNAQALNKDLRYLVKADPGFEMRKRDLEGADNWTVACECASLGDFTMLEDLKFGLKPAQAIAVILEWPELEKADRATLKAKFKEHRKELDKWKYPAAKKTIHGTDYGMGIDTMIQGILKESLSELPLNLSEAKPLLLSQAQAERLRTLVLRRYPGILHWHERVKRELIKGKGEIVTSVGHIRRFYGRKKEWNNGIWKVNHSTFKEYLASLPQFVTTYATKKALQRLWYDPENNPGDGSLKSIPAYVVHDSLDTMNRIEDSEWCNKKELEWFDNPIEIAGITVTIPSERAIGSNWGMKD